MFTVIWTGERMLSSIFSLFMQPPAGLIGLALFAAAAYLLLRALLLNEIF